MAKFVFHDQARCNGCGDCEIECMWAHDLSSPWSKPLRVVKESVSSPDGQVRQAWVRKSCQHCAEAPCLPACRPGALQKRADGIVWIEAARCDGCGDCIPACPVRAIRLDLTARKAVKCDLCQDLIDRGQVPACVARCDAQALFFGTEEEWEVILQKNPKKPKPTRKPQTPPTVEGKPVQRKANNKVDVPKILEVVLLEEISIDGMCGIY